MVKIEGALKNIARSYVPPAGAQYVRKLLTYCRYWRRKQLAHAGYRRYGEKYPHNLLFVAGLPKSGTSWMESMLASYPGFHNTMIPEAVVHELERGGSHDYELPKDLSSRFQKTLTVLKLHTSGSAHNVEVLEHENVPYLIMYRDLRDVAVSHYFYVRRTPWHPEFDTYAPLDLEDGLLHFGETLLPAFDTWVRSWHRNRNRERSIVVRYEDLLADTASVFGDVVSFFGLDDSEETIQEIVEAHAFENLSGGREKGAQSESSFYRKGVSGDWKNHFTDRVRSVFKENAGGFWVDHGYEATTEW